MKVAETTLLITGLAIVILQSIITQNREEAEAKAPDIETDSDMSSVIGSPMDISDSEASVVMIESETTALNPKSEVLNQELQEDNSNKANLLRLTTELSKLHRIQLTINRV